MPFQKNKVSNPAGRKKGTPNKSTDELRNVFTSFLTINLETMQSDFDKLDPKDRLSFIERIAKMVLPALPTAVKIEQEFRPITGITFCNEENCNCSKLGAENIRN